MKNKEQIMRSCFEEKGDGEVSEGWGVGCEE